MILAAILALGLQSNEYKAFAKPLAGREWSGAIEAPKDVAPSCKIADAKEPGDRIIVAGKVFKPDGKTPASGVLIYVYHTDSQGNYSRGANRGNGHRHGKLRGWMLTGADGAYEIRSIKPGGYPGRRDPVHIHVTLTAKDFPEHYIDEYLFDDDPRLSAQERAKTRNDGRFNPILKPTKGNDGVWRGVRDLKLQVPSESNGGS